MPRRCSPDGVPHLCFTGNIPEAFLSARCLVSKVTQNFLQPRPSAPLAALRFGNAGFVLAVARKAQASQTIRCTGCGCRQFACSSRSLPYRVGGTPPLCRMPRSLGVNTCRHCSHHPVKVVTPEVAEVIPESQNLKRHLSSMSRGRGLSSIASRTSRCWAGRLEQGQAWRQRRRKRSRSCSSCQAELPVEAVFCPDCGAPAGLLMWATSP